MMAILMVAQWNLQAQRPGPGPQHRGPALEKFAEELGITEAQQEALKALHETQREEAKALMEKEYENREARREAMKNLRDNHKDALDAILTEAQLEKLETLKEEAKANRATKHQERKENFKTMRSDLKTYRESEVMPVLREQRTKLEAELSTEDKATIAALRAKHEAMRAEKPNFEPGERRKRPELTDEQRANRRTDREKVKALVAKYDTQITSLLEEIEDQKLNWKEDMQEIGQKYAPKEQNDRPNRGKRGAMKGKRLDGEKRTEAPRRKMGASHPRGRHHMERDDMGKAGFLLLDPNASEENANMSNRADFAEVRIFPNPSASRNTVSYKLKEAGHYRVELRDKDGLVLQVVSNEYRQAGDYREELDLSSYSAGTYYLSIVGAEGVVSKKVVVAK